MNYLLYLKCSSHIFIYITYVVLFILSFIDYLLLTQHDDDDKMHEPDHLSKAG